MPKILAQAGISLADAYDVEGSIAGTDELLSKEVALVHEMGATMQSERLRSFLVRLTSTAIAQSLDWTVSSGQVTDANQRVLGASVFIAAAELSRVDTCMLSIQNGEIDREIPFMTWDRNDDPEIQVRWDDDGVGVADFIELRSSIYRLPQLMTRVTPGGPPSGMPVIRFRGSSAAFGAGTVEAIAIIHLCRAGPITPTPGHPSSHGLPLPGW